MKKEVKRQRNKRYIEEHGTEKLRRQREAYANNPQEKMKKSQYYKENQPPMSKSSWEEMIAMKTLKDMKKRLVLDQSLCAFVATKAYLKNESLN